MPFFNGGLVTEHAWLSESQFLDAEAVALITSGPAVITTGFIGYLLAGPTGGSVAAVATSLCACLFTTVPVPYFKK